MASPRIKTKAAELAIQCTQAAAGITTHAGVWPAAAPTTVVMSGHATALAAADLAEQQAEAAYRQAQADRRAAIEAAQEDMRKVDDATDLIHGQDSPVKLDYGLPPKHAGAGVPGGGAPAPLAQVIIRLIKDGLVPGSIFVDFEPVEGAVYQCQWFTDSAMTQQVGDITVTSSEFTASGLTLGAAYWFRVRAVRGGAYGPWSDPATRRAN